MKKILMISMLFLTTPTIINACDICGCGVGSNYIGILPEFRNHILGIRYRSNKLLTHVGVGGSSSYLTTTEYYRTTELWGGFKVGKNLRLITSVPYSFIKKENQSSSLDKNGIGDISGILFYQLLNTKKLRHGKLLINNLWLGGGIKLPTGEYNPIDKMNTNASNLFQLGTGSVDFSINSMYDLRYQDAGINFTGNYKMNLANSSSYLYGNKLSLTSQFYYKFKLANKLTIAPNAGLLYETAQKDVDNNNKVDVSGGTVTMGGIGMETTYNNLNFGINWQLPIQQDLANEIVKAKSRIMMHISFTL